MLFSLVFTLTACATSPPSAPAARASSEQTPVDTAFDYRTAIHHYIETMARTQAPVPDTLFIGHHPDFPAIALPDTMGRTVVRIIDPAQAEHYDRSESFAYLNVFGRFAQGAAEFTIVRFERGMRHRTDGRDDRQLHYTTGPGPRQFVLKDIR